MHHHRLESCLTWFKWRLSKKPTTMTKIAMGVNIESTSGLTMHSPTAVRINMRNLCASKGSMIFVPETITLKNLFVDLVVFTLSPVYRVTISKKEESNFMSFSFAPRDHRDLN